MGIMSHNANAEIIQEIFNSLHREFGKLAPQIIQILAGCIGGVRLTFPDLQDIYREDRNRRIRNEFTGANHEELAIKYRLKARWVRRILQVEVER